MAVRPIDANVLAEETSSLHVRVTGLQAGKGVLEEYARQYRESMLRIIDEQPTLTQPNEWVSVKIPPTEQGWYHVAILDLKTGEYKVEQDLYSIELAKIHGFEPGFCKANRWEEREHIDYWCRFPSPPDRRPPEGEKDI